MSSSKESSPEDVKTIPIKYPASLFDPLVPFDCTKEDYEDLLNQASSLTFDEAKQELLDCARYGEIDAVRAILAKQCKGDKSNELINSMDDNGNTALHKSCANGHDAVVALLLHHKAQFSPNKSENTPLHWAAANGHEKCVQLLVTDPILNQKQENDGKDSDTAATALKIDVLQKNQFGRSALTEGFSSQNTKVVGLLLEHDSAEEERLIGGNQKDTDDTTTTTDGDKSKSNGDIETNGEGNEDGEDSKTKGVIHEFLFRKRNNDAVEKNPDDYHDIEKDGEIVNSLKTLLIRELPIAHADNPFGEKPEEDTTGLSIWCASLVMSRWMASPAISKRFDGKIILELGAGCAVPGLTAALYSNAKTVYVTDINPRTVKNIEYNIQLNEKSPSFNPNKNRVFAQSINWDDPTTWPESKVDYIIGSDLIYQSSIVPYLTKIVRGLLSDDGCFLYVAPEGGRDGLKQFIQQMKADNGGFFASVSETIAPSDYTSNPLKSEDEEDCFLHFHELGSTTYVLHEFSRVNTDSN